jgi:hypothetical protein
LFCFLAHSEGEGRSRSYASIKADVTEVFESELPRAMRGFRDQRKPDQRPELSEMDQAHAIVLMHLAVDAADPSSQRLIAWLSAAIADSPGVLRASTRIADEHSARSAEKDKFTNAVSLRPGAH